MGGNGNSRYNNGITYAIKKKVAKTAHQSSQLGLRPPFFVATKRSEVAMMANPAPTTATTNAVSCSESLAMSNVMIPACEIDGCGGFQIPIGAAQGPNVAIAVVREENGLVGGGCSRSREIQYSAIKIGTRRAYSKVLGPQSDSIKLTSAVNLIELAPIRTSLPR